MIDLFNRLAPFIRDYIYEHNWTELKEIQLKAFDTIFNSNDNLILASKTASRENRSSFFADSYIIRRKPFKISGGIVYQSIKGID